MTFEEKIDQCFNVYVPQAFNAMHEIHKMQSDLVKTTTDELRDYSHAYYKKHKKISLNDEEMLEKIVTFVGAVIEYENFISFCNALRDKLPEHSIKFVTSDPQRADAVHKLYESIKIVDSHKKGDDLKELNNALVHIVNFIGGSRTQSFEVDGQVN